MGPILGAELGVSDPFPPEAFMFFATHMRSVSDEPSQGTLNDYTECTVTVYIECDIIKTGFDYYDTLLYLSNKPL